MAHEENFTPESTGVTPEKLDQLFAEIKSKLLKSSAKYGNTMWINDINTELQQEIIDIVGWAALEAFRLLHVVESRFISLDRIYWDKFLNNQTDASLTELFNRIQSEIENRKISKSYQKDKGSI